MHTSTTVRWTCSRFSSAGSDSPNTFDAVHAHDALYYILFAWKQLAFSNEDDELHLVGKTEHMEWLLNKLKSYLRRVYPLNPVADLNRAPASLIQGMEYDLML